MSDYDRIYRHENENGYEDEQENEQFKRFKKVCEVNTCEDITITVPAAVHAHVNTHDVKLRCKGHEIIREPHCKPNVRRFKICQRIHAHIPIDFIAEVDVGEGQVDFDLHS